MTHLVFVYGTLLRGLPNAGWLADAAFLGQAVTSRPFRLVDLGRFPAMVEAPGHGPVTGELYAVSDAGLSALDVLEDVPALYVRLPCLLADGRVAEAYVMPPERVPPAAVEIEHGDYRRWLRDGFGVAGAD